MDKTYYFKLFSLDREGIIQNIGKIFITYLQYFIKSLYSVDTKLKLYKRN